MGHERSDRPDGVEQPAAGVPRRGPDDQRPRVQRRHRQAPRRGGRRILTKQEQRATELLLKHRRGLELVAEALLERETIDGREVANYIQQGLTESGDTSVFLGNVLDPESDTEAATGVHQRARDLSHRRLGRVGSLTHV